MFKKGQLAQSMYTGLIYVVQEQDGNLLKARAIRSEQVFNVNAERLRLIGNNYQAKQKCSR